MKQKRLALLLGIIILAGLAYWWMSNHKASAPEDNTTPAEGAENVIPTNSNSNSGSSMSKDSVVMSTQTAGSSVTVDNYYLSKVGYISIEELDHPDSPGPSVGHSGLLQPGAGQDLEINATIKSGHTYFAVIYIDDGDKKFNASKDQRLIVNGKLIDAKFTVK